MTADGVVGGMVERSGEEAVRWWRGRYETAASISRWDAADYCTSGGVVVSLAAEIKLPSPSINAQGQVLVR